MSAVAAGQFVRLRTLLRHKLVKNTAALMLVQMSAYAAPLLVLPYLSRVLTTEHFGLIAFATSFNWYFITLVEYGFNLTATRRIAINRDDPEEVSRIFGSVMSAKALLTVLGFILMLAVVLLTPKLRPNLVLFCVSYMAVVGDLLFPLWLFQGLERMENLVWRDLCSKLVALALVFTFVHNDRDYLLAAAFQSGATVVAGILGLSMLPFITSLRLRVPRLQDTFEALREGWSVFLSMAAMTLTSSTNIFLLGLRSGPTDVAYYTAAYRLVVAIRMLVSPTVTALYPHISHMAVNSRDQAIRFLKKHSLTLAAPFLACSLGLLAFAPLITKLLYGQKYLATIPLMRVLAFSPFLLALQQVYSTFFMLAFGYQKEWSRVIFKATILNFILLIPMIYGIWPPMAVAITGLVLDLFVTFITFQFYRKHAVSTPAAIAA